MDLLNEVSVTLVVKAPNQKVADQTVECALNWTVKKLKEHLSLVYPSKPTEHQQRIIYSGKLLQDDLTLKDVLCQHESSENIHTVHLVCSNSLTDISTSRSVPDLTQSSNLSNFSTSDGLRNRRPASSETRQDEQENRNQQPHTSSGCSPMMTNYYGADRLQFQASAFHPSQYNVFTSSYLPSGAFHMMTPPPPLGQTYTAEQLRWLQQQQQLAYAQYMSNYMQFFQQGGNGVGQPFSYAMPHFGAPPTVPENAVQDHPANAAEEQVQPQQPQVVRMNAQGGRVDNDEDEDELDRDWLDWFYIGLRFALFMCILYFYSTPVRFITTLILMLFICCFQFGWLRFVGQRQQPAEPPMNPPDANAAENPDGTRPVDSGALGREAPRQPGGLSLAWSVFLSFFASLAPHPPPPINAN